MLSGSVADEVRVKVFILLMLMLGGGPGFAQDGLYAPAVPEDAALVRVVNATAEAVSLDLGPLRYADVEPFSATAYRPLLADVLVVSHDGAREVMTAKERSFLSLVLHPGGIQIIEDERHTDPARAQLVVYNLSSSDISLRSVDPEATIIPRVGPDESGVRVVNAVPVTLGAYADEERLVETPVDLERGESYTLVVLGADAAAGTAGFLVQASVASE